MKRFVFAAAIMLCFVVPVDAFAQTSNATLGGTVSDATGAFIPGVQVTARNIGTGIVNTTITNETGTYQFPSLQPGTYQVSAELPGFQTATYNNVVLGGAQQVRLNFTLQVGDVATTVEVVANTDTIWIAPSPRCSSKDTNMGFSRSAATGVRPRSACSSRTTGK